MVYNKAQKEERNKTKKMQEIFDSYLRNISSKLDPSRKIAEVEKALILISDNIAELKTPQKEISDDVKREDETEEKAEKHRIYLSKDMLEKEKVNISFSEGTYQLKEKLYVADINQEKLVVENEFSIISGMIINDNFLNFLYEEIQLPGDEDKSYNFIVEKKPILVKEHDHYVVAEKGVINISG
ncbi:MAG: hypothetical protein AB1Z23_09645 [Eubacteriales bacterium]